MKTTFTVINWPTCYFILFFDVTKLSFSILKVSCWWYRLPSTAWNLECPFKVYVIDGGVDGGKNTSQKRGSLPISQVPIRLMNFWYGRPDRIMDPLPSRGWFESIKLNQRERIPIGFYTLRSWKAIQIQSKLTYPAGASLNLTTSISHSLRSWNSSMIV